MITRVTAQDSPGADDLDASIAHVMAFYHATLPAQLSRLNRLMAQPKRDDCSIHAALQKLHRGRVAKNMGRNALQSERRIFRGSGGRMLPNDPFDCIAA